MPNQETAIAVVEQPVEVAVVEWNLDTFPEAKFNRLIPTQTVSIPTDLLRPVVQVVQLNTDEKAGDVYSSKDMPEGHASPTKVGLRKLATAAGISIVDERRTDDGTDPDVIEVTCLAEMLLPTGQQIRATGIKRVDLDAQTWSSPAHRKRFASYFLEHVASRAQNRAIRALLSLRGSYPKAVLAKPFAVVSFAPNMAHPEIRARYLDGLEGATMQLYGGRPAPKQIGPGPALVDAPPAAEEDPAPAPKELPGEKLTKAEASSDEPAWMREASEPKGFAETIRDQASEGEDPEASATKDDLAPLRAIFEPLSGRIGAGIAALWDGQDANNLSRGQARALAIVHDSLGPEAFAREWAALVDQAQKAAA